MIKYEDWPLIRAYKTMPHEHGEFNFSLVRLAKQFATPSGWTWHGRFDYMLM